MRFLDTNIILRAITKDDLVKSHACAELFLRVQRGEEQLETSQSVIAEAVYVLASRETGPKTDRPPGTPHLLSISTA
jgi:predicted nucleic acid-binding protein